jgi:hypothetical protein
MDAPVSSPSVGSFRISHWAMTASDLVKPPETPRNLAASGDSSDCGGSSFMTAFTAKTHDDSVLSST